MSTLLNKKIEEFIPRIYLENEGLVEVCRVTDIVLEQYFEDLNIADLQRNPKTATYHLQDWANMIGCNIDGMSNENAQNEILMSMKALNQVNKDTIKRIVETNTNAECNVAEFFNEYRITITFLSLVGIPANIQQIKDKIRETLPAHLDFKFIFKYRTWGALEKMGKTWGYFNSKGYTWEDMRTKIIL